MFGFFRRGPVAGTIKADRSSVTGKQPESLGMYVFETHNPQNNQAESGRVNNPINSGPIYRHMMGPVVYPNQFNMFIGMFHVRAARVIPVLTAPGYDGIMPTIEQPTLTKPLPYK